MNIFLCGSHHLTSLDKIDIEKYLQKYALRHQIYVLCYKSLENEVLRFYIENEEYAKNLHLITLHPFECLSSTYQEIIEYLQSHEAELFSFDYLEKEIYKSKYIEYLKEIFTVIDIVVCMYNGDRAATVIPIDVARELGIEALIYDLPNDDILKAGQDFESKIRIVTDEYYEADKEKG